MGEKQERNQSMTGHDLLILIAKQRAERIESVLKEPSKFKVCEGCSSLLFNRAGVGICPYCGAYRFSTDPESIIEIAKLLENRTLALGCAVLPRDITPRGLSYA
jgi:RNA polymerase subunit RPABC4/transcription elongation factor Spt4